MSRAEVISERAARWILAQEDDSWDAEDQASLDAWLAESDGNRTAYLRLRLSWQEVDRIAALGRRQPLSEEHSQLHPRIRWPVAVGLAASLALALLIGGHSLPPQVFRKPDMPQMVVDSFSTPVGGRRTLAFTDGSTVQLNTASKVRTAIVPDKREVWLDEGEAFFEVAHKQGQPFIVHAGDRQVTVLGTKFSVRHEPGKVTIAVLEGRVRVDEIEQGNAVRSSIIRGGDIAIASGPAMLVASHAEDKVEAALAWQQGMLIFDQASLGEIVAEFNRYNSKKMVVRDPETAALRLGGMFPAHQPSAFTRLLRDAYGIKIAEVNEEIMLGN